MLTIKEITVKNYMSVGNQVQAINFADKSLVLVIGENMDLHWENQPEEFIFLTTVSGVQSPSSRINLSV